MGKNYEYKEQLLKDSETEILLKKYLLKIDKFMGEEFAITTLCSDEDIIRSLKEYTFTFDGKNSQEIAFTLIRNALLSNNNSDLIVLIKEKIEFGELQDVLDMVSSGINCRRQLAKLFIHQADKTDKELYDRLENKEHVIEDLDNLKFYENILHEREKNYKLVLKSN